MKNLLVVLILLTASIAFAQDSAKVEKSITGIQVGPFGAWLYQERAVGNAFSLRGEIGLESTFGLSQGAGFYNMRPVFAIESRWYFNQNSRLEKGKSITGNQGWFLALRGAYRPDLFQIANENGKQFNSPDVSLLPSVGYRGKIGQKFDFELGVGIGAQYVINANIGHQNQLKVGGDLRLRVGYTFGK